MDKKYFIPKWEDFRQGFIFELKYIKEGWTQEIFADENDIKSFGSIGHLFHALKGYSFEEHVRVKHLDKEDILSLGWEMYYASPTNMDEIENLFYGFKKNEFKLNFIYSKSEPHIEIYEDLDFGKSKKIKLASNLHSVYEGVCPSINDLIYLQRLLKI